MRYEELITCFSLVGSAHRHKGLAITIGVVGGTIAVVDRVSLANSHCRGDNRGSVNSDRGDMAIGLTHKTTSLARHLPLDRVTLLPGQGGTPLHGHLDSDVEGDSGAGGDGLGGADSLWHLLGHGDTLGLGHLDTHSVGDISTDHRALLSGDLGTLGHCHTVGDSHTVRLRDGLGHGDTDRDSHTVRHRHAAWHSHSPQSLHRNLSALSLNLLLTRSGGGGNSNRGSCNSRGDSKRSSRGDGKRSCSKDELGISISLGLSLSLTLGDPGGDGEGVQAESANQRSNSGCGGDGGNLGNDCPNTIEKAGVNNTSGGNTSNSDGGRSGDSDGSRSGDNGLLGDHLLLNSDSGLELRADLGDNVPALLGEAG